MYAGYADKYPDTRAYDDCHRDEHYGSPYHAGYWCGSKLLKVNGGWRNDEERQEWKDGYIDAVADLGHDKLAYALQLGYATPLVLSNLMDEVRASQ